MGGPLKLNARLAAIHGEEYPRFSDGEMARRRAALARVMEEALERMHGVERGLFRLG